MPTPWSRLFLAGAGALALAGTLAPAAARAQFVTVEVRAGVVPTVGKYADAVGVGQTIGVGLSSRFAPTLSVRLDADASNQLDGDDGPGTLDLYTYTIGLETQLVPQRVRRYSPVQLSATLGGGASQLRGPSGNDWRPAVAAGLRLTANVTRSLGVFAGATASATLLGGAQGSADVVGGERAPLNGGGTLVTVPLVAGVRIGF